MGKVRDGFDGEKQCARSIACACVTSRMIRSPALRSAGCVGNGLVRRWSTNNIVGKVCDAGTVTSKVRDRVLDRVSMLVLAATHAVMRRP